MPVVPATSPTSTRSGCPSGNPTYSKTRDHMITCLEPHWLRSNWHCFSDRRFPVYNGVHIQYSQFLNYSWWLLIKSDLFSILIILRWRTCGPPGRSRHSRAAARSSAPYNEYEYSTYSTSKRERATYFRPSVCPEPNCVSAIPVYIKASPRLWIIKKIYVNVQTKYTFVKNIQKILLS